MGNFALGYFVSRFNSGMNGHLKCLDFKYTKIIIELVDILYVNGIIRGYKFVDEFIRIFFKYNLNKHKTVHLTLVSKPSRRIYWTVGFLSKKFNKNNICEFYIISTTKGLKLSTESLLGKNLGGEVLLKFKV